MHSQYLFCSVTCWPIIDLYLGRGFGVCHNGLSKFMLYEHVHHWCILITHAVDIVTVNLANTPVQELKFLTFLTTSSFIFLIFKRCCNSLVLFFTFRCGFCVVLPPPGHKQVFLYRLQHFKFIHILYVFFPWLPAPPTSPWLLPLLVFLAVMLMSSQVGFWSVLADQLQSGPPFITCVISVSFFFPPLPFVAGKKKVIPFFK